MIVGPLPEFPPDDIVEATYQLPIRFAIEVLRAVQREPTQHRITSWWRSVSKNAQVGGSQSSQHLIGLGIDVAPQVRWLSLPSPIVQVQEGDHSHFQLFPAGIATELVRALRR